MPEVNKQGKPTLRQRQAQATRSMIVEAAQDLFLERGYTGTTIEAIAEQAEVAVSTVYAIFGSKRGILRALREPWHQHSHIREVVYGDPHSAAPSQRLEELAQAMRKQWESSSEVVAIYRGASAADPEAAAELAEALEGRRRGMEAFAASLEPHLHQRLDITRAAAVLQALGLAEVYDQLVRRSGWSPEAYQAWLAQALKRELLAEAD